jgi:cytochrome b pre-mRNA-processing protein 3
MILNRFWRTPRDESIAALYGAIVAQARHPAFYRSYGVPDTVNGRFEMIIVHLALVLSRLEAEDAGLRRLGQGLFDRFCSDMDANMREMGVGDLAVPRKMKAVGEAFYGRRRVYQAALMAPASDELGAALARNVYGSAPAAAAAALAAYVRDAARRLAAKGAGDLQRGRPDFPDPAAFMEPADGAVSGTGAT